MADYFDRLLARHAPAPPVPGARPVADDAADGRPVRVRPRLPGPYERIEALWGGPSLPEEPAPARVAPPPAAGRHQEVVRYEREVRTDRHTVVRAEPTPYEDVERYAENPSLAPLLIPSTRITATPHPAAPDIAATARGATAPPAPEATPAGAGPRPGPSPAGVRSAPAAVPLPPRAADPGIGREAARLPTGRRRARSAQRTVHVQIGRLEVTAAAPPGADRSTAARPGPTGRRAPALSLDDYLARGERRD
ncbi:hypothetical protein IGW14_35725 [Streptomyces hygroscopicus subsp. hygroscopicus]|uniref:Uncharacterized protein n=1 Tax=Streptomyces demainii TaxID=588122 RepID=A0ABT9L2Q6_9ACTN|nr:MULTISPECIES: hypothetical protein [Streptomyces]MBW8093176.1 hypothetical protein [Streptomyces hygroscopicus subsp. hygroscopicus]MDP9614996.1 hypothetical protein [Streptomyces demainii]